MIILDLTFLILLVSIFAVGGLQSASGPFCSFAMFLFENNWLIFLIALALFAVVNHEYSDQECLSGSSQISFYCTSIGHRSGRLNRSNSLRND